MQHQCICHGWASEWSSHSLDFFGLFLFHKGWDVMLHEPQASPKHISIADGDGGKTLGCTRWYILAAPLKRWAARLLGIWGTRNRMPKGKHRSLKSSRHTKDITRNSSALIVRIHPWQHLVLSFCGQRKILQLLLNILKLSILGRVWSDMS